MSAGRAGERCLVRCQEALRNGCDHQWLVPTSVGLQQSGCWSLLSASLLPGAKRWEIGCRQWVPGSQVSAGGEHMVWRLAVAGPFPCPHLLQRLLVAWSLPCSQGWLAAAARCSSIAAAPAWHSLGLGSEAPAPGPGPWCATVLRLSVSCFPVGSIQRVARQNNPTQIWVRAAGFPAPSGMGPTCI